MKTQSNEVPERSFNALQERGIGLLMLIVGLALAWLTLWLVEHFGVHEVTVLPGGLGLGFAIYGVWRICVGPLERPETSIAWKKKGNTCVLVFAGISCMTFWGVFFWMDELDWSWQTSLLPAFISALAIAALLYRILRKEKKPQT